MNTQDLKSLVIQVAHGEIAFKTLCNLIHGLDELKDASSCHEKVPSSDSNNTEVGYIAKNQRKTPRGDDLPMAPRCNQAGIVGKSQKNFDGSIKSRVFELINTQPDRIWDVDSLVLLMPGVRRCAIQSSASNLSFDKKITRLSKGFYQAKVR